MIYELEDRKPVLEGDNFVAPNAAVIGSVTLDDTGRREILLRDRPEKIEVSRTFAHLFKSS